MLASNPFLFASWGSEKLADPWENVNRRYQTKELAGQHQPFFPDQSYLTSVTVHTTLVGN